MPDPLLSIVTPCLNQALFVRECLESISSQDPGNGRIEHIIMDGGSTDGSTQTIQAHARNHPDLVTHWCSQTDAGQSDAINRGVELASGRFATWLNADDWYEPEALAAVLDQIERHPDTDVLVGRCRFVDLDGHTVWDPAPPDPINVANLLRLRTHWFNGRMITQPEAFFRRSKFHEIGALRTDNHFSMDHELWVELALAGARFEAFDHPVACLRVHADQKSADNRAVVRSMLKTARHVIDESPDSLGLERADVESQIAAMRHKLHIADAMIARWELTRSGECAAPGVRTDRPPTSDSSSADAALYELAAPHTARVLKAARRALGPRVVASLLAHDKEALTTDLKHTFRRVATLDHATEDAANLVVTHDSLACTSDPQAALNAAWSSLKAGGVLVLINELVFAPGLMCYLNSLQTHLTNHLSTNNDLLLHPEADARLEAMFPNVSDRTDHTEEAQAWLATHPSCAGIDIPAILARLDPPAQRLVSRTHGSYWHHPLAPFPFVPSESVHQEDTRLTGAWRKGGQD